MRIRLHSYFRSSSAWRVRIALALKGLDFELVPVHLVRGGGEQHGDDFRAKNPMGQVPVLEVLEHGETFRLTQSMAILEYLEERFLDPPLLPRDRDLRARVRELSELVNSGIQPLQNLSLRKALDQAGIPPAPFVGELIEKGLRALEARAEATAGRFLVGDALTFADVYLVPQLYTAERFGVDPSPFPTLSRVERACAALPAFQGAHARSQPDYERGE
jgi:maleylpyruvate isomerase